MNYRLEFKFIDIENNINLMVDFKNKEEAYKYGESVYKANNEIEKISIYHKEEMIFQMCSLTIR